MRHRDKRTNAGVYLIFCLLTGLAYIGASGRLRERFQQHLDSLRLNRHPCKTLQSDWNEFGADCFALFPLELIRDTSILSDREGAWTRKCLVEGRVYNQRNAVTERHKKDFLNHKPRWPKESAGNGAKKYIFVSPDGQEMPVRGLRGICQAYDLNVSHMSKVARGIYVQHRGFTAKLSEEV